MSDSNIKFVKHPVGFRIFYVFFGDDVEECLEIQVIQVPETDIDRKLFDIALVAWSRRIKKSATREFLFMQDASRGEVMLSAYGLKRYLVRMRARVSREDGSIFVGGDQAIPSPTVESVGAIASESRTGTGAEALVAGVQPKPQPEPVPLEASVGDGEGDVRPEPVADVADQPGAV